MTTSMNKVMDEIETLTPREKGFVAQYIIASLDTHQDENSTKKWELLALKRYEDIVSGKVETVSWDDIKQQVLGS